jgi:glutamine amidotransferase
MIRIVDYGLGNVQAFLNMYKRIGIEASAARDADDLSDADKLVLPGVGAFDHAIKLLDASGMRSKLEDLVQGQRVPVLGVCVGMQMLADASDEGEMPGLGWIQGQVRHFKNLNSHDLQIPHMGWNDVQPRGGSHLFRKLESDARFYFLHSFYFVCTREQDEAARASYGAEFCCAVQRENIYGVQFHPEKSHHFGAQLLRNFAEL